jgi:hypothetical protein
VKLDFLISASPTDGFFGQIAFFRLALDALGGVYRNARLVAVFGDHESEQIPERWRGHFDRIDIVWAHAVGADNPAHRAQHDRRFEAIRHDADLAFLCDADVAPLRPFPELLAQLTQTPALAGVIAHLHFPRGELPREPDRDWPEIAQAVLGAPIDRPYRYTLIAPEEAPAAPFYINYGVFAGPPDMLRKFYRRDLEIRDRVADIVGHWWAPQVSVALTCADLDLPTTALPMRYNFPNDPVAERMYPGEANNIVFLHYLRKRFFDRSEIFAEPEAFDRFMEMYLEGSNAGFQRSVATLTGGEYPFE